MANNILEKVYGNMDYNTFKRLQKINSYSICSLVAANSTVLGPYPIISSIASTLTWIGVAYALSSSFFRVENYTKDITQIKRLYDEVITKYNKLNKTFSFENPVEIYSMFDFLLYKDYLSKDKNFEFSSEKARDINAILGANVINGEAVCRHISAMLNDIYKINGIDSNVLIVYGPTPNIAISEKVKDSNQTIEQLYEFVKKHINNEELRKAFNELIDKTNGQIDLSYSYINDKSSFIKKHTGNHAITLAVKNGKSYFLDPTKSKVFKLASAQNNSIVSEDRENLKICKGTFGIFNSYKDCRLINNKILLPSTSFEEDNQTNEHVRAICKNNLDIFEKFYSENSAIYNEISELLMQIKKPKTLIKRIAK